jgi:hypothetical protein
MSRHGFAILSLACVLTLGVIGTASAHDDNRWPNIRSDGCGWSDGQWNGCDGRKDFHGVGDAGAPELDPNLLGSGIIILAGGVILLNERRRARK